MQVKKQQLELDMEKQSGSKSGKEYIKAVLFASFQAQCHLLGEIFLNCLVSSCFIPLGHLFVHN